MNIFSRLLEARAWSRISLVHKMLAIDVNIPKEEKRQKMCQSDWNSLQRALKGWTMDNEYVEPLSASLPVPLQDIEKSHLHTWTCVLRVQLVLLDDLVFESRAKRRCLNQYLSDIGYGWFLHVSNTLAIISIQDNAFDSKRHQRVEKAIESGDSQWRQRTVWVVFSNVCAFDLDCVIAEESN